MPTAWQTLHVGQLNSVLENVTPLPSSQSTSLIRDLQPFGLHLQSGQEILPLNVLGTWPEQTMQQLEPINGMWSPKSFGSGRGKSQHTSAETHCPFYISQLSSRLLETAEKESSPFFRRWHPHLITLYLMQPFNILAPSWHFSRKAKKDESGLLFLPRKETHPCAETTWKRGAGTGAQLLSVLCHYIFCESLPLLSKHDGNKLSALTRDCMRINFPTRDCSFILNPVNQLLYGSSSPVPQVTPPLRFAVPCALPLFLPSLSSSSIITTLSSNACKLQLLQHGSALSFTLYSDCHQPFSFSWWKQHPGQSILSLFSEAPWERWDRYLPGHVPKSIIMQVSAGAILLQFAFLWGPRICSLIILNEVVSQLESAFLKVLFCLMILFVNFK